MARELGFWKYEKEGVLDDEKVYGRLCVGEEVAGVGRLPVDEAIKSIRNAFGDWDWQDETSLRKKGKYIEIFATSQFVRFDCGSLTDGEMNKIIDIMNGFGCPLYDPAISTRFAL